MWGSNNAGTVDGTRPSKALECCSTKSSNSSKGPDPRQCHGREPSKTISLGTFSQCPRSRITSLHCVESVVHQKLLQQTLWRKSNGWSQPSQSSAKSSGSCEIQIQSPTGGRQDRGLQEFHRTCQASRCSSGRDHQESSRTKRRLCCRGGRCRAKVVAVAGGAHGTHSTVCYNPRGRNLQRQIAELVRERDQLRQGVSESAWRVVRRCGARFVSGAPNALYVCSGFARLVVRQKLRVAQRLGTRGCRIDREAWQFVEPGFHFACDIEWRRFDGREVEVLQDVFNDRRSRHQTQMFGGVCHVGAVTSREPSLRSARYGLRGIRVGKKSHPGLSQSDRKVPNEVLDVFEFELSRICKDDFQAVSHSARRERSRSPRVAHVVEHDLTRFDSDDEPLSRLTHIDTPSHVGQDLLATWRDDDGVDDEKLREGHYRCATNRWVPGAIHAASKYDVKLGETTNAQP